MRKLPETSDERRSFLISLGKWSGIVSAVFVGMTVALPLTGCVYSKYSKYSDYWSYSDCYYYYYCSYNYYYGYYYCYYDYYCKDKPSNYVNYSDYVDSAG